MPIKENPSWIQINTNDSKTPKNLSYIKWALPISKNPNELKSFALKLWYSEVKIQGSHEFSVF